MPYRVKSAHLVLAIATALAFIFVAQPVSASMPEATEFVPAMEPQLSAIVAPAQQETEQVYALPGRLRRAQDQTFSTYLVGNDGNIYGLVGETPEVEDKIVALREAGPDVEVKVWGTLYPDGRSSDVP
jgi:hypothetical protein